ncbi:hypothetical protein [Nocardia australiensis]|uniref:hypothetical protein n=1 Tax=Nocardia australiensis TaxID=2887191 RepID=UPI001D139D7E|nr:hypothetical protein [Nocardia australiensis]
MNTRTIDPPPSVVTSARPKAIGLVRNDVSGLDAERHATAVQRHARTLGYQYLYTVRPPDGIDDSIGYTLAIAAGLGVETIVVFGLEQVNCRPALICDAGFDLETVCPPGKWARSAQPVHRLDTGAA